MRSNSRACDRFTRTNDQSGAARAYVAWQENGVVEFRLSDLRSKLPIMATESERRRFRCEQWQQVHEQLSLTVQTRTNIRTNKTLDPSLKEPYPSDAITPAAQTTTFNRHP